MHHLQRLDAVKLDAKVGVTILAEARAMRAMSASKVGRLDSRVLLRLLDLREMQAEELAELAELVATLVALAEGERLARDPMINFLDEHVVSQHIQTVAIRVP